MMESLQLELDLATAISIIGTAATYMYRARNSEKRLLKEKREELRVGMLQDMVNKVCNDFDEIFLRSINSIDTFVDFTINRADDVEKFNKLIKEVSDIPSELVSFVDFYESNFKAISDLSSNGINIKLDKYKDFSKDWKNSYLKMIEENRMRDIGSHIMRLRAELIKLRSYLINSFTNQIEKFIDQV